MKNEVTKFYLFSNTFLTMFRNTDRSESRYDRSLSPPPRNHSYLDANSDDDLRFDSERYYDLPSSQEYLDPELDDDAYLQRTRNYVLSHRTVPQEQPTIVPRPGPIPSGLLPVPPGQTNDETLAPGTNMRRFCFTVHLGKNISDMDNDEFNYTLIEPDNAYLSRVVFQYEAAPTTGSVHIQGYAELTQPRQFRWIKTHLVGESAHVEKARGTARQNYEYCTKDETRVPDTQPFKMGDWSNLAGQGRRTDLGRFSNLVRAAPNLSTLLKEGGEEDEFAGEKLRYVSHAKQLWLACRLSGKRRKVWDDVDYQWVCGPSGVGKTYDVYDQYALDDIYEKNAAHKWWDGYTGQQVILINEYRRNKDFDYATLLQIADVYPFQIEVKGGVCHLQNTTEVVIITSNQWPWETWPECEIDPRQTPPGIRCTPMVRRMTLIQVDEHGERTVLQKPSLLPNVSLPRQISNARPVTPSSVSTQSGTPISPSVTTTKATATETFTDPGVYHPFEGTSFRVELPPTMPSSPNIDKSSTPSMSPMANLYYAAVHMTPQQIQTNPVVPGLDSQESQEPVILDQDDEDERIYEAMQSLINVRNVSTALDSSEDE